MEFGRGKRPDPKKMKATLSDVRMPSGVPIKKVRLLVQEKTIQPIRSGDRAAHVKPGSTHHLCILEWEDKNGKTKRGAVFVTMLEATQRIKRKEPIIQRMAPADHENIPSSARFVMSLSRGELVLADCDGNERLLVYNTAASTTGQMAFYNHTDARKGSERQKYSFQPGTLRARKVTVDSLGRIRWAND